MMKLLSLLCSIWFFQVQAYPHSHRNFEDPYLNQYDPYHYDPYLENSRYPVAYDPYAGAHVPRYDYDHYAPPLEHKAYIPHQPYETLHPDSYHNQPSWNVDYQDHVHLNPKLDDHHQRPVDEYRNGGKFPVREHFVHLHPNRMSGKGNQGKATYESHDSEYNHKRDGTANYNLHEHVPNFYENEVSISEYDYPVVKTKNEEHHEDESKDKEVSLKKPQKHLAEESEYKIDDGKHEKFPANKKKHEIHEHGSISTKPEKNVDVYEESDGPTVASHSTKMKHHVEKKHPTHSKVESVKTSDAYEYEAPTVIKHGIRKETVKNYNDYDVQTVSKGSDGKKVLIKEKHPIPSEIELAKTHDVYEYEEPTKMKHTIKKETNKNYDYDVHTASKSSDEKIVIKEKHSVPTKVQSNTGYSSSDEYEVPIVKDKGIKEHKTHEKEKTHTMKPKVQINKHTYEYGAPTSTKTEVKDKKNSEVFEDEYETYTVKKPANKNTHAVHAVTKKEKNHDDYETPIVDKLVKNKEPLNTDDGFEAPVIVETLTKIKKPTVVENEYETPKIIEILTKNQIPHSTEKKQIYKQIDKDPDYKLSHSKNKVNAKEKPSNNKLKQETKKQKTKETPEKKVVYPSKNSYNNVEHVKTGHVKADYLPNHKEKPKNSLLVTRENDGGYSIPIVEAMALEEHENEGNAGIHIFEFGENSDFLTGTEDVDSDPKVHPDSNDDNFHTGEPDFDTEVEQKLKNEELSKFESDKESESEDKDIDEFEDDGKFEKDGDIDEFEGSGMDLDERSKGNDALSRSFLPVDSNAWSVLTRIQAQERRKFKKCLTPKNESGNCMPIQLCSVSNIASSVDDILKNVCIIDEVFIGVCCPEFPVERVQVDWEEIENSNDTFSHVVNTQSEMECGRKTSEGSDEDTWPWMTTLMSSSSQKVFCGGVLIKEQYVLTAAHCTTRIPRNQILVRLHHPDSAKERAQNLAVVEIKRHANYNPRTMQNDIALLKLPQKVKLGKFRQVICIADEETEDYVGENTSLLRWNRHAGVKGHPEALPVILNQECQRKFSEQITDFVLCAEPRTEEIMCNADSGAPLIRENEDGFQVIGVLTWNRKDCDGRFPSVFTKISSYHRWIENHSS